MSSLFRSFSQRRWSLRNAISSKFRSSCIRSFSHRRWSLRNAISSKLRSSCIRSFSQRRWSLFNAISSKLRGSCIGSFSQRRWSLFNTITIKFLASPLTLFMYGLHDFNRIRTPGLFINWSIAKYVLSLLIFSNCSFEFFVSHVYVDEGKLSNENCSCVFW